ncbi:hypothetical protein PGB90_010496 [Kerria lacca]
MKLIKITNAHENSNIGEVKTVYPRCVRPIHKIMNIRSDKSEIPSIENTSQRSLLYDETLTDLNTEQNNGSDSVHDFNNNYKPTNADIQVVLEDFNGSFNVNLNSVQSCNVENLTDVLCNQVNIASDSNDDENSYDNENVYEINYINGEYCIDEMDIDEFDKFEEENFLKRIL